MLTKSFLLFKRIHIGKNQNPKKPGFFVVPFTLPEKPITFRGFFARKAHARQNPESHTGFLVSGAHARLLSTFVRNVVRSTSRAASDSAEGHVPRDQKPE